MRISVAKSLCEFGSSEIRTIDIRVKPTNRVGINNCVRDQAIRQVPCQQFS